jgi:hypothetical protein
MEKSFHYHLFYLSLFYKINTPTDKWIDISSFSLLPVQIATANRVMNVFEYIMYCNNIFETVLSITCPPCCMVSPLIIKTKINVNVKAFLNDAALTYSTGK